MASARTELRVPVSSATTEISGHQVRGLELDLEGDQTVGMLETGVSTVEGQAEGQVLLEASMEMSEMEPFLELEREDVLPTLVLGQPGGLTLDLIGHQAQEPPEDQAHHQLEDQHRHQQDDQHRHQLEDQHHLQQDDQHRLQQDDQEAPLQREGHSRVQRHLRDQPIGQAQEIPGDLGQDQPGDQPQRPPENHSQDQRGGQRWDQPEDQTPVETDEDQILMHLVEMEALEELDPMDDQDLVAKEEIKVDLVLGTGDHKDKVQDLDLEQLEAMVLVPVEDQDQMVLEEVLVDDHLMQAL